MKLSEVRIGDKVTTTALLNDPNQVSNSSISGLLNRRAGASGVIIGAILEGPNNSTVTICHDVNSSEEYHQMPTCLKKANSAQYSLNEVTIAL